MSFDLIDSIISQRNVNAKEQVAQKQSYTPVLNAQNVFITGDNPDGVFHKENYQKIIETFNREELLGLASFYNSMRGKEKLETTPFPRIDKKGVKYYWITFTGKNGNKEFKLPDFHGLAELIDIYLSGKTSIEFDFDTLHEESISS